MLRNKGTNIITFIVSHLENQICNLSLNLFICKFTKVTPLSLTKEIRIDNLAIFSKLLLM